MNLLMSKKKRGLFFVWILCACLHGLAQVPSSVNSSGGNAQGADGLVSYSVGQVLFETYIDEGGSLGQGVQHTYDIFELGVEDKSIDILLELFPNPVTDRLFLRIEDYPIRELSYEIVDMAGGILKAVVITQKQMFIDMSDFSMGTYLFRILEHGNTIHVFKVIKK